MNIKSVLSTTIFLLLSVTTPPAFSSEDIHHVTPEQAQTLGKYVFSGDYQIFLKFSITVDESGKFQEIFFQDTNAFEFHAEYLRKRFLSEKTTAQEIDAVTLRHKGRRFLLGTLLATSSGEDHHVEFISDDAIPAEMAIRAMLLVQKSMLDFSKPAALLVSRREKEAYMAQQNLFASAGIPLIFQSLNATTPKAYAGGWTLGRLRALNPQEYQAALEKGDISETDILILDEAPRELPLVAGVIVKSPTTPSSHIALLAQMYGIPFFFHPNADAIYAEHLGQLVFLQVVDDPTSGYMDTQFAPVTEEDKLQLQRLKVRPQLGSAPYNNSISKIQSLKKLTVKDVAAYGAKAVGLGRLMNVLPDHTADFGFAVPIHYYSEFTKLGINDLIAKKTKDLQSKNHREVKAALAEIRKAILETEIPAQLLQPIMAELRKVFGEKQVRLKFRSSSNVEDLRGFNGAGLYDSKGAKWPESASVADAIRAVWASVFNDRAFLARREMGINEAAVGMGLLVQKSFKGEVANGVALVAKKDGKFVVRLTGFPGEDLEVTAAPPGVVPETTRVEMDFENKWYTNLIQASTEVPKGRNLLRPEQYAEMADLLKKVFENHPENDKPDLELDLEWKVMAEGNGQKIYFKQVRPVPETQMTPYLNMVVLGGTTALQFRQPENEEALLLYHLPKTIEIDWHSMSLKDLVDGRTNPVRKLKFEFSGGTEVLPIQKFHAELRGLDSAQTDDKTVQLDIVMHTSHKLLGPLEFGFSAQIQMTGKGFVKIPAVLPLKEHFVLALSASKIPTPLQSSPRDYTAYYSAKSLEDDGKVEYKDASWTAESKDKSISFQFVERALIYDQTQKTTYRDSEKVTIKDTSIGEIVVNKPGVLYAPAHHNFISSHVIDLNHAQGKLADLDAFRKKYGRFIVIAKRTLESGLELFSYRDDFTLKLTMELLGDSGGK